MIEGYTAPNADEVVVKRGRLAELERKEQAHDAYMKAVDKMRLRQIEVLDRLPAADMDEMTWAKGWLSCLHEFSEAVVLA